MFMFVFELVSAIMYVSASTVCLRFIRVYVRVYGCAGVGVGDIVCVSFCACVRVCF